jgi:hypothetical protein
MSLASNVTPAEWVWLAGRIGLPVWWGGGPDAPFELMAPIWAASVTLLMVAAALVRIPLNYWVDEHFRAVEQ